MRDLGSDLGKMVVRDLGSVVRDLGRTGSVRLWLPLYTTQL